MNYEQLRIAVKRSLKRYGMKAQPDQFQDLVQEAGLWLAERNSNDYEKAANYATKAHSQRNQKELERQLWLPRQPGFEGKKGQAARDNESGADQNW